jgi:2-oxoglutarate ferredoxin oxidoreductase subunit alpha
LEKATTVLIGFGSTYGVMKEASERNPSIGFVHFSQVWPLPVEALASLALTGKKLLTVENNATGQLARLLRAQADIKVNGSVLKYDGRPFDIDDLLAKIEGGA